MFIKKPRADLNGSIRICKYAHGSHAAANVSTQIQINMKTNNRVSKQSQAWVV